MSDILEIFIRKGDIVISRPGEPEDRMEFPAGQELTFREQAAEFFMKKGGMVSSVVLYVAEELLFMKTFQLPLETRDLKEAVGYQIGLLAPFAEDSILYSFSSVRKKEGFRVTLYAAQREPCESYLQEIAESGFQITGLFPESQRYVNRSCRHMEWALVMPGRFVKILVFSGTHLQDQLLCNTESSFAEIADLCGTDTIYHLQPPENDNFLDSRQLSSRKPLLKEYNLLPASYRRPDFSRMIIVTLVVLNLVAMLFLVAGKGYRLKSIGGQVDEQINALLPIVKEVKALSVKERQLEEYVGKIEGLGSNPDLIAFLKNITEALPKTAYLDQMRMDKKQNAIIVQGYTEDISELTGKLQAMGEAKLKSTSRRRNKTYFNVEINLP